MLVEEGEIQQTKYQKLYNEEICNALLLGEKSMMKKILMIEIYGIQYLVNKKKFEGQEGAAKKMEVKVNGATVTKEVNEQQNQAHQNDIMKIFNKDQCMDIFKDIGIQKKKAQFHLQSHQKFIRYKYNKIMRKMNLDKLNALMKLKMVRGMPYITAMKLKIQLARDLLILEIEQGNQVYIPYYLSQDNFPMSFRYYDPILQIVKLRLGYQRKEFFTFMQAIEDDKQQNSMVN